MVLNLAVKRKEAWDLDSLQNLSSITYQRWELGR